MSQHLEAEQLTPAQSTTRLIVPPLREAVHRVSDTATPERAAADGTSRRDPYFWEWIDSLKAVRYL
jgi:hypothetical protein